MQDLALLLIFWYGILHAFGADHLSAIADFSLGKNTKKTMLITSLFALGHGLSLLLFAKILEVYNLPDEVLAYGDTISALVILSMGIYLLYMVFSNKIHLNKHIHKKKEHVHIYFGKEHSHSNKDTSSAFAVGTLMGIGGVRGMLVTLGLIQNQEVNIYMVLAFTLGVMLIFVSFGACILYINKNLLNSKQNLRRIFTSAGLVSSLIGVNMLIS